jgi:DNA-binding winged helix-turn-helix (wHTH) protein
MDEQMVLLYRAGRIKVPNRLLGEAEDRLHHKGVLGNNDAIFSPLFANFISQFPEPPGNGIELNDATRELQFFGWPAFRLTPTEFRLFKTLYKNLNQSVEYSELVEAVWTDDDPHADIAYRKESIKSIINRIRRKMGQRYASLIENISNQGYILWENLEKAQSRKAPQE